MQERCRLFPVLGKTKQFNMKTKLLSLTPRALLIVYVIICAAVILYNINSYFSRINSAKEEAFKDLVIVSDLKAKRIQSWRTERYGDAAVIMNSTGLLENYADWLKSPGNEAYLKEISKRIAIYTKYFDYQDIILIDKSRNVKFSNNPSAKQLSLYSTENFNLSAMNYRPSISNLYYSELDSTVYLDVAAPFYIGEEFIGGMVMRINPERFLYPELENRTFESESYLSGLFSVEGQELTILNNMQFPEKSTRILKVKLDTLNSELASYKAAKGQRGMIEGYDYNGNETFSEIREIENSPWILITKVEKSRVYSNVKSAALKEAFIGIFILALFGAGFLWLWQSIKKSRQIQELEAEAKNLEVIKHYEKLVLQANIAMVLSNENLRISEVNDRAVEMFGYTKKELIGMNLRELIASDAEMIPDGIKEEEEMLKKGIVYESLSKRKDGSLFDTEISLSIVEINGKNFYQRIISDITERKQAAEKLRDSKMHLQKLNREKDQFFSIIAHDLREPLGSFMNVTKMMDDSKYGLSQDEKDELVKLMKESSTNLYALLENLLEWSMLQRGITNAETRRVNLKDCIDKIININKESAAKKNIDLNSGIKEDIYINTDERMLNSIFRNLVNNAVKFTKTGGKVCVNAEINSDNMLQISVNDNGIGMSREIAENLFDNNVNTKRLGTDGEPSSGLGLVLCKEFAEKLGGKIVVETEKDSGSTFRFLLPAVVMAEKSKGVKTAEKV